MHMLVSFFREVELEGNRIVKRARPYWTSFWLDLIDVIIFLGILTTYVVAMKCVEAPAFQALFSTGFISAIVLLTKRYISSRRSASRRNPRG